MTDNARVVDLQAHLSAMCGWAELLAEKAGWSAMNASVFCAALENARAAASVSNVADPKPLPMHAYGCKWWNGERCTCGAAESPPVVAFPTVLDPPMFGDVEARLRERVDFGEWDGYGLDPLHIAGADAIRDLRVALASQIEITNAERAAKEALGSAPKMPRHDDLLRDVLTLLDGGTTVIAYGKEAMRDRINAALDTPPKGRFQGEGQPPLPRDVIGCTDPYCRAAGRCLGHVSASPPEGHRP